MGKLWVKGFGIFFILALLSCKENTNKKEIAKILPVDSLLQIRYQKILDYPVDSVSIPRSFDPKIK